MANGSEHLLAYLRQRARASTVEARIVWECSVIAGQKGVDFSSTDAHQDPIPISLS